jgi:hypothetical protein
MRAVQISPFGGPEVLEIVDVPLLHRGVSSSGNE